MRFLQEVLGAAQLVTGRVRDHAEGTAGAILVSRTASGAAHDLPMLKLSPRRLVVLGQGTTQNPNLLQVLDDPLWQGHGRVVIGGSVADDLHPILASALTELCRWIIGDDRRLWVQKKGDLQRAAAPGATAIHLSRWILAQARAVAGDEPSTTFAELQQLLTSGGHRASALDQVIDAAHPGGRAADIIEIGGGIGLISWLIAAEERRGVRQVFVVDPIRRHELAAQQLWGGFTAGSAERCAFLAKMPAYRFPFGEEADVVFLCQTLYAVPPERREAFFARCWSAVKPGGTLILNEIIVDDAVSAGDAGSSGDHDTPRRNELIALLSKFAEPQLYREVSNWRQAEDPLAVSAREYYASSFIVLRREL